ncbi:MAG: DUF2007 domain-containing protein [Alphaproteobacteria bacterium]|nr:DUF2007 domain-containing protein [Alphaproteobacteria bacterium]
MKRIYRGTGPADAWLVKHWLERNGVASQVRSDLVGLAGEIPSHDAWPTVWVADELADRASELVRAFEGPTLVHPRWRCPACGEDNEPNFGSCWSCGGDAP